MTAFQRADVRFVCINVSEFDAHKLGAVPVVGDARETLEALLRAELPATTREYRSEIAGLRAEWDATVTRLVRPHDPHGVRGAEGLSQAEVIGIVNSVCDGDSTVINAAGSMPGDLVKLWRSEDDKAYHVEYGFSCMGYEIPAGIGVKLADPGRHVVAMIGDGSYLMLNSEIVTAVAEGLDLTIVVVDNHGFQSINSLQKSLGMPSFANELRYRDADSGLLDGAHVPIDFVGHARALGADATIAHDAAGLTGALLAARRSPGVKVVVVKTPMTNRVPGFDSWWDVPVATASQGSGVAAARAEYERQVATVREHRFGAMTAHDDESEGPA